jgi:hypothetical protein
MYYELCLIYCEFTLTLNFENLIVFVMNFVN